MTERRWSKAEKEWAQSVHLPKGGSQGLQRSIHRSQLEPTTNPILRLHVVKSESGEEIEINNSRGQWLKFCTTGGTDDPSFEIRLSTVPQGETVEEAATGEYIGLKFSAFPTYHHQLIHQDREVVPFSPKKNCSLNLVEPVLCGPTSFTEELYDLRWTIDSRANPDLEPDSEEPKIITLSWKSKALEVYNLSQRTAFDGPDLVVANNVCRIADDDGEERTISVDIKWCAALEYRYRYLLACPTGLVKYWRAKILNNVGTGSVPVDLCKTYPRDCTEVYELEAMRPTDWVDQGRGPLKPIDDIEGRCTALRPKRAFMSVAEAEYYLKGAFLYEEHLVSELRKAHFDNKYEFSYWRVGVEALYTKTQQWLLVLDKPFMFFQEEAKLPRTGSKVTVAWRNRNKKTVVEWEGKVLGLKHGATFHTKIAILVSRSPPLVRTFSDNKLHAYFTFSAEPEYCQYILDSIDGVIFEKHSESVKNRNIHGILMGRDGHQPLPSLAPLNFVDIGRDQMDVGQNAAFNQLSTSTLTIVISPPGCGKTMIASKFCAACVRSGERILVLSRTDVDARQLYQNSATEAKGMLVDQNLIDSMMLVDPMSGIDELLSEVFSMKNIRTGFKSEVSQALSDKFELLAGCKDIGNATAVFATVNTFSDGLLRGFNPTIFICDNADSIPDYMIFAVCGAFSKTLERVSLFADEGCVYEKNRACEALMATKVRGHFRRQLEFTTVSRLIKTGIKPVRLDTQYRVDPDIASYFRDFTYNGIHKPHDRIFCDSLSARKSVYLFTIRWVVDTFKKPAESCKGSVFVNVEDGQCLSLKNTTGLLNLQNLIVIAKIIQSMPDYGVIQEQILVLTFFRRSVAPIKEFLKSQGLYPRVEHVDSERIKDGPNAVVIIDVPTSDIVNPYTGDHLSDSRRNEKALVLPSSLRIVVGREDLGQSNDFFAPSTKPSYGESFWLNFVTHHMRQGMVKSVNVGDRILKYERDLESKNYWMVSEYRTEASEMFDAVRFDEEDEDTSIPLVEAGEAGVERLSDHDIERHERSSSVEAGFEISSFDHDAETDQSPQSVMDGNIWKRKELALGSSELNETPSASYDEGSKYGNDIDKLDRIKKSNWR